MVLEGILLNDFNRFYSVFHFFLGEGTIWKESQWGNDLCRTLSKWFKLCTSKLCVSSHQHIVSFEVRRIYFLFSFKS